ncbi:MAG: hypothetical protein H7Z75_07240 [Ferruginibacter sp.]|nr:hypothetical protein [Cytophagales bacterium]
MEIRYTLENSFASITYEPAADCGVFTYKRFGTSEEFRNSWAIATELAAHRRIHKWLFNSIRMEVLRPEDQDWFVGVIAPQLRASSSKTVHVAVVVSENAFSQLSMTNIIHAVEQEQGAVFEHFDSEEKGLEWLKAR